jgi:hypothetical protein
MPAPFSYYYVFESAGLAMTTASSTVETSTAYGASVNGAASEASSDDMAAAIGVDAATVTTIDEASTVEVVG